MPAPSRSLKELFLAALEVAPPDRAAWLERECAADTGLREHLGLMLAADAAPQSLLDRPGAVEPLAGCLAPGDVGPTTDPPIVEAPGTVIGPYKLLEPIGEGGMGTVWMAQQTEPVKRLVAVKLIKPGMDSKQVIARFEAERQALALMDHPNIAKVLDGGTIGSEARTSGSGPPQPLPEVRGSGRPYFVMDLVKGVPITRYCDEHHLTPRQRLELFLPVCQAVQHAHQKGIIHRDLKPSNVLVAPYDGRPVPKVIDFGVAKAAGQPLTDRTLVTGFGSIVGTLEYMSPEQAEINQLDIDTRSDIYSLGVLLYELLTGSPPFTRKELEKAGMLEMLRVIREQEPSKPSTKLSSSDALPTLSANRGTEPAKLTKLVRGELDWIVMKALEKDRCRRYETANGFAMDVQRYLADEPVQACPPSARYRLRKFARRNKVALAFTGVILLSLLTLTGTIGWALRDQSARQAKVAGQVEAIFAEVDRLEGEQKWPEALAAARRAEAAVAGGEADRPTAERVRARRKDLDFIDRLEQIRMQRATWVDGTFDDAGANRDYARAFCAYGVDVDGLTVATSIDRLKARPALAIALAAALDDWVSARVVSTEDAAGCKRLVAVARGLDPEPLRDRLRSTWEMPEAEVPDELRRLAESIELRAQHPATLVYLALRLQGSKQSEAAFRLLRNAQHLYPGDFWLNFYQGFVFREKKDREGAIRYDMAAVALRPTSTAALTNLGIALSHEKKVDDAIACYRKAIKLDPKHANALINLGNALRDQKRLDEAIACHKKAIDIDPKNVEAYSNLGIALRDQKKLPEAVTACQTAIELDPNYAKAYNNLGIALHDQEKLPEAITAYQKAIELDPNYALAYRNVGKALYEQKKLDEAIAAYHTAIKLDPNYAAFAYNDLGVALKDQNKLNEAIAAYRKAIEIDPTCAIAYSNLGIALAHQKKLDEAIACYRKAIELDPKVASPHFNLGNLFSEDLKDYGKAVECYRKAIELDPKNIGVYNNFGNALRHQKRFPEAIAAFRKAIELDPERASLHSNLGALLCDELQEYDQAIECFRTANKLDPAYPAANRNLGVALGKKALQFRNMKDAAGCLATAAEYETLKLTAAYKLYDAACVRALCASAVAEDPKTPAADAARLAREQADLAMAWLHKAYAAGFNNANHMKRDTDLDALRGREDFKKLEAELEAKQKRVKKQQSGKEQ